MARMHITAQARLIIESGILVSLVTFSVWLGVQVKTLDAYGAELNQLKVKQEKDVEKVRDEQTSLAHDMIEMQKEVLQRLSRIEERQKQGAM